MLVLAVSGLGASSFNPMAHAAEERPAATIDVSYDQGLLTAVIRDAPLTDVLRTIAERANLSVEIHGELTELVTYSFENTPLQKAIGAILGDNSWLMIYRPSNDRARGQVPAMLAVYGTSGAPAGTAEKPALPATAPQSPTPNNDPIRKLEHPKAQVRLSAIRQLATEKMEGDVEFLAEVLASDEDPAIRQQAGAALAEFRGKQAAAALTAALTDGGDPSPAVRQQAVWSLGALRDENTRWALEAAAQSDPDETVRRAASAVLSKW